MKPSLIFVNGVSTTGRNSSQDDLEASAKAYLNAIIRHLIQTSLRAPVS
ncbi:hypothetical protein [Lysinibacillus pakistanensis]|uniref:NADPH-dependent FMN reductase-like domain-containing protein n=1 Tax=Lysinibacillus pakistanensis TaxID=759811 RepID=A0AAX3WPN3_9BACI|nr:hypothetical protein [Lysinibacillus pakistanensis]MDM5234051.1 hypothetical protein [Lysinibacillus pakistanensis]WHY44653.1 hypothetical protein QNH22_15115 [Lysinibacillus pakistanensis]WHY49659.1 hypothetical protein QNH24_15080 [Lysinibacillus pakistanensis]